MASAGEDHPELTQALDWVLRYLGSVRDYPVLARVSPGEIEASLPTEPPREPEPIEAILEDLDRILVPGITHWNHPRFFGYFAITGSVPGIAGELISSALNVNAMLWRTSPAATELEAVATRWLARMLGLPPWFGVINDTASSATFSALAAARHARDPGVRARGLSGAPPMAVYASDQAHSSVDKAVLALGTGTDYLRKVCSDEAFRLDPKALERAVLADMEAGIRPMAVVATVGTTATTSVDPVAEIADVCERYGVWLHVDAAYAGAAALLPERRFIFEGAERADSLVVNPHKWLFVPVDCSVLYVADPDGLRDAFSVVPDYLRTAEEARNLMDYGIPLGRRFRALKLWIVLRSMGTEGIQAALREHLRLASLLAAWIEADPSFELLAPVPFSVVNFRYAPGGTDDAALNEANAALADAVNQSGEAMVTTARLRGQVAIHVAVGHLATAEEDVRALWELIRRLAEGLSIPGLAERVRGTEPPDPATSRGSGHRSRPCEPPPTAD